MKYTIELTDNQKKQMDLLCEIINRHIGFNPKLEPIKTTNIEDTNEYQIGYKVGYESAIHDYNMMITYIHNCKGNFRVFMARTYNYIYCNSTDVGTILFDLVRKFYLSDIITKFKKWKEDKDQSKKEFIEVGDEVTIGDGDTKAIVTKVSDNIVRVFYSDGTGELMTIDSNTLHKTGRNFSDEVEQLLDKLRGKDSD